MNCNILEELHLAVSLRSFRSEIVSGFVKQLLDVNKKEAQFLYNELKKNYPLVLTRDISKAKEWVKDKARGTERYGITSSSGSKRLRTQGIWVQSKIDAVNWFLNDDTDVRSSYYLEDTATEFDIQGLELDWTIVAWDANLRFINNKFKYFKFVGTKWQNIKKLENKEYLKNAYRVLLTRARQGMIIFVPKGNIKDKTTIPEFYDETYNYLKEIGIEEI